MAIYVLQHITFVFFHIIRNEIVKIYFPFRHVNREKLIHTVPKYFHVCSLLAKMLKKSLLQVTEQWLQCKNELHLKNEMTFEMCHC